MTKIVQSAADAVAAIIALNEEIEKSPELASRLGQAHAYYVINEQDDNPLFGFSKFVGYKGLSAETYLRDAKEKLTGINTEHALAEWFEEVRYGTSHYNQLLDKLTLWLARFGKRPRQGKSQKLRLMVLKPEYRSDQSAEPANDDLLKLLIAVADHLTVAQRLELRNAL